MGWKRDFQRYPLQTSTLERLGIDFRRFWDRFLELFPRNLLSIGELLRSKIVSRTFQVRASKKSGASRSMSNQVYLGVVLEPKTPPRRPKMPPKTPRRGKTPPRRPKTPPRRAQDAPKTPQRRPKRPQEVPRRPPRPSQIHPKSILMLKTLKIKKTLKNQWKINDF